MLNVAKLIKPCYIDRQHIVAVLNVKTVDFFLFLKKHKKQSKASFCYIRRNFDLCFGIFFQNDNVA